SAGRGQTCARSGGASVPHSIAPRADDFDGHAVRLAADGVENGHRKRSVCTSGDGHHRRPERLIGRDGFHRARCLLIGLRPQGASGMKLASLLTSLLMVSPAFAQTPRKLTLQEAEALAVQTHPQIAGARLATQAAGQVIRETRSSLYPQVSASATAVGALDNSRIAAGFLNAPNVLNRVAAGASLQQLVTDFGRTGHLVESSKLREQSQEAGETATRALVLLDVDRAYFRALRAQGLVKTAQETVTARQLVVDQVTALAQSALKSQLDVSFANVNLSDAKLLLSTAQNEVQEAFSDLSNAMGLPGPQTFE